MSKMISNAWIFQGNRDKEVKEFNKSIVSKVIIMEDAVVSLSKCLM